MIHHLKIKRCLIKIKDIFKLDNASEYLRGFVAFTFEILAINGKRIEVKQ